MQKSIFMKKILKKICIFKKSYTFGKIFENE